MKKLNGKLIAGTFLAAAMLSVNTISAGAVDYGGGAAPTTLTPVQPSVLTDKDVSDAIAAASQSGAAEVTVEMEEDRKGNIAVQESAIAEIAKSDVTVTVEVISDSGTDYSVTIDPALITEAKAINLAMDITIETDGYSDVSGVEIPAGSIIIAPAQKGDFGMTLQVTIPADAIADVDTSFASLYYIADNGSVTRMPDSALKVNADGSVTIAISHASQYVISDIDLTDPDSYDDFDDIYETDDDTVVVSEDSDDENPGTGVTLAFGALAISAAAVALTAKKRK